MRNLFLAAAIFFAPLCRSAFGNVSDFSDLTLNPNSYVNNTTFASHGISFNNSYDATYGSWSGFSYSNVADSATPGFGNQYASYPGGGVRGAGGIYAVAYPTSTINLPAGQHPVSVDLTNTTYAALSMKNGDTFAKKFGGSTGDDPDYFDVTLTGYTGADATGSVTHAVTFYLADYRFADHSKDYIVSQWTPVDLTSLGDNTTSIDLSFASSDIGTYGINTPTYVALSDLTTTVPEPAAMSIVFATAAGSLRARRNNRK